MCSDLLPQRNMGLVCLTVQCVIGLDAQVAWTPRRAPGTTRWGARVEEKRSRIPGSIGSSLAVTE